MMCPLSYLCPPCKEQDNPNEFSLRLAKWSVCSDCGIANPDAHNTRVIRELTKDMPTWTLI